MNEIHRACTRLAVTFAIVCPLHLCKKYYRQKNELQANLCCTMSEQTSNNILVTTTETWHSAANTDILVLLYYTV